MAPDKYFARSRFEEAGGFAWGLRDGDMVFMSGCVGFDYVKHTISEDIVEQSHQNFRNIYKGLEGFGVSFKAVVRIIIDSIDRTYI